MTKIQDLEKKVTELYKDVEKLKETIIPIWNSIEEWDVIYSDSCKEGEDILVPENIHIEKWFWIWDGLWILFNDDKQALFYNRWVWQVYVWMPVDKIQCKLIKCNREDLKHWDTAYMSDEWLEDVYDLASYCKILDSEEYVHIDWKNVVVSDNEQKDRYKVVEA